MLDSCSTLKISLETMFKCSGILTKPCKVVYYLNGCFILKYHIYIILYNIILCCMTSLPHRRVSDTFRGWIFTRTHARPSIFTHKIFDFTCSKIASAQINTAYVTVSFYMALPIEYVQHFPRLTYIRARRQSIVTIKAPSLPYQQRSCSRMPVIFERSQ